MYARIVILLVIFAPGCSSTRSILLHRDEVDQSWQTERYLNGVPITLQVPTHIKVDVIEHHYMGVKVVPGKFQLDGNGNPTTVPVTEIGWLDSKAIGVPARTVNTALLKTAQIFTVDPKRPAAGTINSTIEFGGANGQYFDQVAYEVDDQTIEAITGLIGKVAKSGLIGTPTSGIDDAAKTVDAHLRRVDGVVASGIFSLDAPDVELQIAQFLDQHLNNCHTCNVTPDPISATQHQSIVEDPCIHDQSIVDCPHCGVH